MFCGGHRGLAVGTHAREQVEGRKIDRSPTFSRAGAAAIHKMWVHQLRLYKSSRPVHTHGINAAEWVNMFVDGELVLLRERKVQ